MDFDPKRPSTTVTKFAKLFSVERRTVYNWMEKGYLEWCFTPSGTRRIYIDKVKGKEPKPGMFHPRRTNADTKTDDQV